VAAPFEVTLPVIVAVFVVSGVAEPVTAVGALGAGPACALAAVRQSATATTITPGQILS
jgi:hypothetical protein